MLPIAVMVTLLLVLSTWLGGSSATAAIRGANPNDGHNNNRSHDLLSLHERALQAGCVSTIPEAVPYHIVARHSKLVLRGMEDDNSVAQVFSSAGTADNWVLQPGPTPTAYIIQQQGTTNKIVVADGSFSWGAAIEISPDDFADGRDQWCFKLVSGTIATPNTVSTAIYEIQNIKSGLSLDVAGVSFDDGAPIHQWGYGNGPNQQWSLSTDVDVDGGPGWECATMAESDNAYYHIIAKHSGLALAVTGNATTVNAALVQINPSQSAINENWKLVPTERGFYHLIAEHSGLAMAVASLGDGAKVIQTTASATRNTDDWCFVAVGGGQYEIKNRKSAKSIDVDSTGIVQVWTHWGGPHQLFSLRPANAAYVPPPDPGWDCAVFPADVYHHIIAQHNGMALTVEGASMANGANVHQFPVSPATNDNWRFVPTEYGFYNVFVQHSGLALAAAGSGTDGSNVIVKPSDPEDETEDWCFVPTTTGAYELRNRRSAKSIDVVDYSFLTGANAHVWSYWGGDNQKFFVEPINTAIPLTARSTWGPTTPTPLIAAAAANLPNGNIVFWSSFSKVFWQNDNGVQTYTGIYNPTTGTITEKIVQTNHDMFCPGTSSLRDGVLMVTGGSNSAATTFYDYRTDTWSVGPKLQISRGYHSQAVLADGRVLTVGGSWSGTPGQKTGEIWDPATNTWTVLPGVLSEPMHTDDVGGKYRSDNHYWLFAAPNGQVFHAGPSKRMNWIDLTGAGSVTPSILRGDDDDAMTGNALIYDIGLIFTVGGAANYDFGSGSDRAYVININGPEATVTRTGDMYYKRTHGNSVLLPNGEVVVVGGQTGSFLFTDQASVYHAEIWTPSTNKFRVLGPMQIPRVYHSVSILMKDGRVWSGGGGLCDLCTANHADFEILTPPYLLKSNGDPASRPIIVSTSKTVVKAGETFEVTMNTIGLHTFSLVRTSAVTHSTNTDQRRIPLRLMSKSSTKTVVQVPGNINVSVVGVYYLFAMNSAGVPSVAQTVQISL